MDASFDHASPLREIVPGRFTRVSVQTPAGEIEARLSERGNWELRVRHDQAMNWRLACTGDLDCGIVTTQPVAAAQEEVITLGALMVDPAGRRATVKESEVSLARKEFALLLVLAAQPDRVFSKEELLATVWGHTGLTRTRTLDSHASRLRNRLREAGAPGLVVNTRGVGYRLRDRPDLAALPALGPASKVA
ncbi:MAG TPA: winged helix-turn-helix domain-containing protein [Solirubrobacterales bacterium]|jgi:DNA-binding response OmpR family regulator|nr:winged helix-turn-helix domain-containing protein [Solirubrobacterales bacterium]